MDRFLYDNRGFYDFVSVLSGENMELMRRIFELILSGDVSNIIYI